MSRGHGQLARRWPRGVWLVAVCAGWSALCGDVQVRPLLDRPARLLASDVSLREALEALQRASGVELTYGPDLLPEGHRVSCDCKAVSVAEALDRLLADTGLGYRVKDRKVIVGRWPAGAACVPDGRWRCCAVARRGPGRTGSA